MGTAKNLDLQGPSHDERFKRWWARFERLGASPGAWRELAEILAQIDVRQVLPNIQVPTLVIHRTGDRIVDVGQGREIAKRIPTATFVELPGDDHLPFLGDPDAIVDEIEEFLTGVRPVPDRDRVLATVLFTDIVGSTERAAAVGDHAWRAVLDSHVNLARGHIDRLRGMCVKTTGDGVLATFDGPGRAIRCALAIRDDVRSLGIDVRAGLHCGEVELRGDDVGGIAVHIGARVAAIAAPGQVLVSSTVRDLVAGAGFSFSERGDHNLKGVPGAWKLFAVDE
jgi:class 3 adenylate cyclase